MTPPLPPGHSQPYIDGWTARANATPATIAGWTDCDAAIKAPPKPPTPPAPDPAKPKVAPPPAPPTITVLNSDIADLLNSTTDLSDLSLPAGRYTVSRPIVLHRTVRANGSTILFPQSFPDRSPNVRVVKPNLIFDKFIAPTSGVLFEAEADGFTLSNFQIGVNQPAGSVVQAFKTGVGGTNSTLFGGSVGVTKTVSVYIDKGRAQPADLGAHLELLNLAGSQDEYPLRFEISVAGVKPSGATVKSCTVRSANGKDTIGLRVFDDVQLLAVAIYGNIRLGQDPPDGGEQTSSVGQYCDKIIIDGCLFYPAAGSPMCAVQAYEGVRATVRNSVFAGGYTVPCMTAGAFTEITDQGNSGDSYAAKPWASSSRGTRIGQAQR